MSKKVRTRFAPSPTGRMHVGNLRTALYAYLIAKHEGGDFILRVEDTDQERFVEGALDIIYRTLEKTGLVHDEGPDKDGGYGQGSSLPVLQRVLVSGSSQRYVPVYFFFHGSDLRNAAQAPRRQACWTDVQCSRRIRYCL